MSQELTSVQVRVDDLQTQWAVLMWLRENIAEGGVAEGGFKLDEVLQVGPENSRLLTAWFKNKSDAVRFKLTWHQ